MRCREGARSAGARLPIAVFATMLGEDQKDAPNRQDKADAHGGECGQKADDDQAPSREHADERASGVHADAPAFGAMVGNGGGICDDERLLRKIAPHQRAALGDST